MEISEIIMHHKKLILGWAYGICIFEHFEKTKIYRPGGSQNENIMRIRNAKQQKIYQIKSRRVRKTYGYWDLFRYLIRKLKFLQIPYFLRHSLTIFIYLYHDLYD